MVQNYDTLYPETAITVVNTNNLEYNNNKVVTQELELDKDNELSNLNDKDQIQNMDLISGVQTRHIIKDEVFTGGNKSHLNIIYFNARIESWLTDINSDGEIGIVNYNLIRKDRKHDQKKKGGGLVIYLKQEIPFVYTASALNSNIEYMWVKIMFKSSKPISIGLFYRPPDSREDEFKYLLESISMNNAVNTIIIGDFNYGDINWKTNVSSKVGIDFDE